MNYKTGMKIVWASLIGVTAITFYVLVGLTQSDLIAYLGITLNVPLALIFMEIERIGETEWNNIGC